MKNKKYFIEKSNQIYNYKFDYSLINYIDENTNVIIICKEHGQFEQTPEKHILRKQGCPKCGKTKKITIDEFLVKIKDKYNNFFKYQELNFKNAQEYIEIICPKHGTFKEKVHIHLNRNTCKGCKKDVIFNNYIKESNEIHNNKFDYSLIIYNNCYEKVEIICPIHGIFKQPLHSHKQGHGCKKCKSSIGEEIIQKYLDSMEIKYEY